MLFTEKFSSQSQGGTAAISGIIAQKAIVCELRYPHPQGNAWYIVGIDRAKQEAFEQHRQRSGEPLVLTDYGTILHSGWGDAPPAALMEELVEKYKLV